MKIRYYLIIYLIGVSLSTFAQSDVLTVTDHSTLLSYKEIDPNRSSVFTVDINKVLDDISNAPHYQSDKNQEGAKITLQLPSGRPIYLQLHEAPVSHMDHYNKYPENKTYKITGAKSPYVKGRLAISPRGVRGLIYTETETIFVEPLDEEIHVSYIYTKAGQFTCDADMREHRPEDNTSLRSTTSIGDQITEYDIAIASSGEWSNERDNNLVTINDDINTYLSELNAIYESELAVTFTLIADNDDIIFFDPVTDGLDPNNRTVSAHNVISGAIPAANYDIGHVFYEISGGGTTGSGIAGLGVTCNNGRKAEGWTGAGGNYNVGFFMSIFAHEVGHQFDATHSFYGTSNFCAGFNRSAGAGYEPGSGNTLMSYEGLCEQSGACTQNHNISPQSNTIYFHAHSVEQMLDYIDLQVCGTTSSTSNTAPVVTVPTNRSIPKGTPFELTGSATDANGDALVYTWEEYDTDFLELNCPDGEPDEAATSTTAPLFRSFDPSSGGNTRVFPKLSDIINNEQTTGEILPQVGRDIKMRLTARDFNSNAGGVACEDMTLTVIESAGPFTVTTANTPDPAFQAGESVTITWDVNNTNSSPINCNNVSIQFSNDGGLTYPTTLASSTSNDGSHTVTMPSTGTSQGRIKVKAIGNYFFDINDEDITIISDCIIDGGNIIDTESIIADAGDPSLDLMLQSGIEITQMAGNLDANSATANLNCENQNTNGCSSFSNVPKHETITFTVDVTGDYTFTRASSYFSIINIYENSYDNNNVCTNWIASSALYNPNTGSVSIGGAVTENLVAGNTYIVKFSGFSSGNTGSYTVSFSNNVSGTLYEVDATSPAGYTSAYVVVNENNNVAGIDVGPDMTDSNIYSGGEYTIYGLSYISSTDLSPYVGGSFTALQNALTAGTVCGDLSNNTKTVTINGCTPGVKTVTNTSNTGAGSLRTLMTEACPGDMIVFSSSLPDNSTITLDGEIILDRMVIVDGSNITNLTISGGFTNRIFQIPNGLSLSLIDVNLTNGFTSTNGGAFYNEGEVKLSNVTFENNFSGGDIVPYTGNGDVIIESGEVLIKD